jgi:meso-butanediol dehydrogenase/(S,S)-butanediol dehydrogenase/diacetyl reductase
VPGVDGLDGAVAVVTGGASGIGEACVRRLQHAGATVHVVDLAADPSLDVTDRTALDSLAARLDRLDVLINAAGVLTENRPIDELSADDFRRNFEVNVLGTFQACQAFGRLLRERGGAVVNVASQAALVSLPSQAAYTASKGAVAALTRSLAIDWAEHGVRVNAVAPGFTVTPMTATFFENETFVQAATRRIPLGRLLEADEIAGAIVFLAGPQASAITGVVLPVDGGWTAGEPALPW